MVVLAENEAAAREVLARDVYATSGVWDLEGVSVIPVCFLASFFSGYLIDGNSSNRLLGLDCSCHAFCWTLGNEILYIFTASTLAHSTSSLLPYDAGSSQSPSWGFAGRSKPVS